MTRDPVYITRPFLPPLEEFVPYLEKIWNSKILTNGGPLHQQLEFELCNYLGVNHLSLFANGTLALLAAFRALRLDGEVITTPFSFVATSHSLAWSGIKPVFTDIDPETLNLDPNKIEAAITPFTRAILPVHVYGNPCDTKAIEQIARLHGLSVIYDAAHAFGIRDSNGSLLNRGDLSVLSFHATKSFNTFEGGAIVCQDSGTKQTIDRLKNFGFVDEVTILETGINCKMTEICAAFGLLQLKYFDDARAARRNINRKYLEILGAVPHIRCIGQPPEGITPNYSYFPILVELGYALSRDALYQKLRDENIFARRYFYPLISNLSIYRKIPSAAHENLPVANEISEKILCLPIYPGLADSDLERITKLIISP